MGPSTVASWRLVGGRDLRYRLRPRGQGRRFTRLASPTASSCSSPIPMERSHWLALLRQEDAKAFIAQVRLRRRELRSRAEIFPVTLDQLKAADVSSGFNGFPVFQYEAMDMYATAESRSNYSQAYYNALLGVGRLEDVLKKMELNENSGWEDFIFIPPGKSHWQHIEEVTKL